jgi:hypothetical protein
VKAKIEGGLGCQMIHTKLKWHRRKKKKSCSSSMWSNSFYQWTLLKVVKFLLEGYQTIARHWIYLLLPLSMKLHFVVFVPITNKLTYLYIPTLKTLNVAAW